MPGHQPISALNQRTQDHPQPILSGQRRTAKRLLLRFLESVLPADEWLDAPPVLPADVARTAGYATTFPHLLGAVSAPEDDQAPEQQLVLTPVACHHAYPLLSGARLTEPVTIAIEASCYRHEGVVEAGRYRSFRVFEYVHLGDRDRVTEWRDRALDVLVRAMESLGLPGELVTANDPFFGRAGLVLASEQKARGAKREFVTEVDAGVSQAVASVNYPGTQFGEVFSIRASDGSPAHSACLGFGLDRLVLAMRLRFGPDTSAWPIGQPELRERRGKV